MRDVVETQSEIHGADKGLPSKGHEAVSLVGHWVGILSLALNQQKSVQILRSPFFFHTNTSGKAYSLTDLLIMPLSSISDKTSLS